MSTPDAAPAGHDWMPRAPEADGTWLLFDARCSTCSRISEKLEEASAGKLAVLPLDSDFAVQARQAVFGHSPPHKPTLLKVTKGQPRAWVGARIAPLVAHEVGIEPSLRILKVLGLERTGAERDAEITNDRLLSRRGFAHLAAGIAAASGILATGSFTGVRSAAAAETSVKTVAGLGHV